MTPATISIDPSNYDNFFPSHDLIDESIKASKAKGENAVFETCSKYLKQVSGILVGSTSPADSVGQCLVNPSKEIQKSNSLETLIAIAREWIAEEIADSLSEIHNYPLNEGELPLSLTSAKNFLLYSFRKGLNKPVLTATHDGLLQADWDNEEGQGLVAIRFLGEDKVWITTQTDDMKGTVEVKLSSLLSDTAPLNLPPWANE
ncbi:MAG: hypothetical protein U9O82_07755 [Thermodesulfobacteriota bacterium]|nr:hypothetical protein [Thermodesulfobacteriota bacterium]